VLVHGDFRSNLGPFLLYLACGVACSNFKVSLPGVTSTLSVNYLFILIGAAELSAGQTVCIGCASGVAQLFLSARKRPRTVQVLFSFASQSVCSVLTSLAYHNPWMPQAVAFRLLAASLIYFLANTFGVAVIIGLTEGKHLGRLWQRTFFWTGPHYLVGGAVAGVVHFWNRFAGWETSVLVFPTMYLLFHSYRLYLGRLEEEKRHVGEMADLHLRTIQALALAIDARDGTTFGHLRRVQLYARELGRELGLNEDERQALDAAALLHDIGKLAVPEHIISKPGRLTPEEFEKMRVHPIVGAEILESVGFPYPVVPIVRAHHEKWDGTGYPYGLSGDQIPIGARILSAVDCLDALASDRQYRRALPLDEAMERVAKESRTSFDPRVVDVLRRRYRELEELARKQNVEPVRAPAMTSGTPGPAPAAGFEPSSTSAPSKAGFITSIAAARQEIQSLLELTLDLGSSLRLDETMALLSSRLTAMIPYHAIAVYITQGERLVTKYASGEDAALFQSLEIPLGDGISGWVTQNCKPIVNGNPSVEPGYLNDPAKFSVHRSALSVPLSGISGVMGALTLYHRDAAAFTRDHLRVLLAVSTKAGLTIENALRYVEAEETATTDALTGLPNTRSLFVNLDEALRAAVASGRVLSVLVADMDGFKQVNDRYGHVSGNKVLERTAAALRNVCRRGDYVARMGGDEFVLVIPDASDESITERIRLITRLVKEVGREVCGSDVLGLSVGTAQFPTDGSSAEELLAVADARMYEVKRQHHASAVTPGLGTLAQILDSASALRAPVRTG
jgi:diguanylate cyclase (GGDEF)-like protein/putative nucleotidyltransferase with HDIG domain